MNETTATKRRTPKPVLRALVCFGIGIGLGRLGLPWTIGVGIGAIGVGCLASRRSRDPGLLLLLVAAAMLRYLAVASSPVHTLPDRTTVDFTGIVLDRTERPSGRVLPWMESGEGTRTDLRARGWIRTTEAPNRPYYGTFLVRSWAPLDARIRYGTRIELDDVTLAQPSPARNPDGFDDALYLLQRGIDARLYVTSESVLAVTGKGGFFWMRALDRLRVRLHTFFDATLPTPYNALFAGVLLGERRAIPPDVLDDFVRGGVVHVLVVSGANFALLAGTLFVLLRVLRIPLRAVYLVTMGLSAAFALLVGFQPPVVRAGLLIGLLFIGRLLERDVDLGNLLALSALLILMWRPASLYDVGFQLSFGATAGIVALQPRWSHALEPLRQRLSTSRIGRFAWTWGVQTLLVTAAAQVVTTPILAWHFHRFYWAGFLANVPVLLLIAYIMIASFVAAFAGIIAVPLGAFFAGAVWSGFAALLPVVSFFARLPYALVPVGRVSVPLLAAYAVIVFAATHLRWIRERTVPRLTILGTATVAALAWHLALGPMTALLEIAFLDVGQGDATVVRLPNGKTLLIDGGREGDGERIVVPYLLSQGIRRLDWLVVTHPDADHAGGLPEVLETISVGTVVGLPPRPLPDRTDRALREALRSRPKTRALYGAGTVLDETTHDGKRLRLEVVHPLSAEEVDFTDADDNADSLVLMLTYGDFRALFTGDIASDVEAELAAHGLDLRADVLKVPHHGSHASSSDPFLRRVGPQVAVVSAGVSNRYGHPAPGTLARYAARGIRLFRTDRNGAVRLWTDGARCWIRPVRGTF